MIMIYQYLLKNWVLNLRKVHSLKIFTSTYKKGIFLYKKSDALRRLKTECEDYLIIDGVLFWIKILKDKNTEPSILLAMLETYVPTILYQYNDSLLEGNQGVTGIHLTLI